MRALTYIVLDSKLAEELEWLKDNYIFPATEYYWNPEDWDNKYTQIGVIVDQECELTIKLRVPAKRILGSVEYKRPRTR